MEIKLPSRFKRNNFYYYAPINYIRSIDAAVHSEDLNGKINAFEKTENSAVFECLHNNQTIKFYYSFLSWDSAHFGWPFYKLTFVLFEDSCSVDVLQKAVNSFSEFLGTKGDFYCFSEIPSEDTVLLQGLGGAKFKLVETRFNFYHDQIQEYTGLDHAVRFADMNEAAAIGNIAAHARNYYDRVHADDFFSDKAADNYLRTYGENALKGFCECVIVPDAPGSEAFLAIAKSEFANTEFYHVSLVAVGEKSKGWHVKLVSAAMDYAKNKGSRYLLMTTQSTNRAVFRTCEKLGFKLGSCTHIFSIHNKQ